MPVVGNTKKKWLEKYAAQHECQTKPPLVQLWLWAVTPWHKRQRQQCWRETSCGGQTSDIWQNSDVLPSTAIGNLHHGSGRTTACAEINFSHSKKTCLGGLCVQKLTGVFYWFSSHPVLTIVLKYPSTPHPLDVELFYSTRQQQKRIA